MHTPRHYHSLADAAEAAKCRPVDLLQYAVQGKLTLLVGVPDIVVIRVYDETTNSDIEPFLTVPQFLALSQSQCLKIELNGHTAQADFSEGYCVKPSGELYRISPNYGYRNISPRWSYWRTVLNGAVHSIELTPDRLFVLYSDLEKIMESAAATIVGECGTIANLLKDKEGDFTSVRATELRLIANAFDEQENVEIEREVRQSKSEKTMESVAWSARPKKIIKGDFPLNSAIDTSTPSVVNAKVPAESAVTAKEAPKQPKMKLVKPIPLSVEPTAEELPALSEIVRERCMTILRLKQVLQRTGLSRSTIYDKMKKSSPRFDPTFPSSVSLGTGSVGWIESEVNLWLESRTKR